jgi:preprotein translocase subunit SecE
MLKIMKQFLQDVKTEFAKVSWPSKDELKGSTLVTIGLTTVFTIYIFFADKILSYAIGFLYGVK